MTTTTTDALTGHALDASTEVLATLDIDIEPAARATLERTLALDPRGRALATERTDERVAVSRITARITDAGNYVTRHTIACATRERQHGEPPGRTNPGAPRRAEQIAIELETEDGSTISLETDLAILPTWGTGVHTTTIALTRTSTLDQETLTGILNEAERRAARLVGHSTREGDAAALKFLAETVCLGAISAGEETKNTTYTIVIRPPHAGAKDIDVHTDTPPGSDNGDTEDEVTAEQHTREPATLGVRAPDATTAMHKAQREVEREGADWRELRNRRWNAAHDRGASE